ncbi:MAG TPA: dihydropteroate synthase [Patescibacteria group bacterium]|nr:dihydropteroate synthase [Patescibacteria group bacterium]
MSNFTLYFADGKTLQAKKTLVMGILNATPDSFSDGGAISDQTALEARINSMLEAGADILDVGGESTRPGHTKVDAEQEIDRIMPVIQAIRKISSSIPISVDTQKASVARRALEAGASFINDISSLSDPKMAEVVAEFGCSIILMRNQALSEDVINDAKDQFKIIIDKAEKSGINRDKILLDPGLGFGDLAKGDYESLPGSDSQANLSLIKNLNEYSNGLPVVIGASRKRFVGYMAGIESANQRLAGSLHTAVLAKQSGVSIVRVHDVKETVQAFDFT